jgi:hypothetical protein
MMPRLKFSLTSALWLANGLFWLLLIGFLVLRVQQTFFVGEVPPLRLDPLSTQALPALVLANASSRNPFDPAGTPWALASAPAPAKAGQVRGIVVLPGVAVALTEGGVVKPGQSLDDGQLLSVKTSGAVVDTPTGRQTLILPESNRPKSFQALNQAKPATAAPAASK